MNTDQISPDGNQAIQALDPANFGAKLIALDPGFGNTKVCFAGLLALEDGEIRDVRIALGSVAPVPLRCLRTEAALRRQKLAPATVQQAQIQLSEEISPIDDYRSTAAYRRRVALNLLEEFLT